MSPQFLSAPNLHARSHPPRKVHIIIVIIIIIIIIITTLSLKFL
jgi:hypothetical protein